METTLGCGYLINDESVITDFYSPPSSIVDEDDDLFYREEDEIELNNNNNTTFSALSINEINDKDLKNQLKPLPLKLMTIETTTPPSTPLISQRLFDPMNNTIMDFQNMNILPTVPSKSLLSCTTNNTPTNLLTPTSMDRHLIEHRRLSDSIYGPSTKLGSTIQNGHQSISVQNTEVTNDISRLYSYMTPIDGLSSNFRTICPPSSNSWSNFDNTHSIPSVDNNNHPYMKSSSLFSRQINPILRNINHSSSCQDPWFLSTILRQNNNNNNNNNILLSTTAQQILNGNNRPLRSEKIDNEVIKHLIQEANWKRQCGMKKEICVFCRNNGENELIYSSHSLKDSIGNVTCPILRAYQCPICGATGSQAHTIKYCQSTGNDDHNRHVPTPYEKMLRMQTFGFDDNLSSTISPFFGQFGSPSSLYTNGWSNSYL